MGSDFNQRTLGEVLAKEEVKLGDLLLFNGEIDSTMREVGALIDDASGEQLPSRAARKRFKCSRSDYGRHGNGGVRLYCRQCKAEGAGGVDFVSVVHEKSFVLFAILPLSRSASVVSEKVDVFFAILPPRCSASVVSEKVIVLFAHLVCSVRLIDQPRSRCKTCELGNESS